MTKRVRVIAYIVTPQVALDNSDDDSLTVMNMDPIVITPRDWVAQKQVSDSLLALTNIVERETPNGIV